MTPLRPLTTRRQFILSDNKWHVTTVRSRRKEMILRDLCLFYYNEGQNECTEATVTGETEKFALDGECTDSIEVLECSETIQNEESTTEPPYGESNISLDDSLNTAQLQIGCNKNLWIDFGSDHNNFVTRKRCLPVIVCAPGNCNSEIPIYFDVQIGGCSQDLCFSIDSAQAGKDLIEFTIQEGGCQMVFITWSPLKVGGIRESVSITTAFNGVGEIIARDEIVVVGCAGRESMEVISEEDEHIIDLSLEENQDDVEDKNPDTTIISEYAEHVSMRNEFTDHVEKLAPQIFSMDEPSNVHDQCNVDVLGIGDKASNVTVIYDSSKVEPEDFSVHKAIEKKAANVTIITDSSKIEFEEELDIKSTQSSENSSPNEVQSQNSDSSAYSDLLKDDDEDHQFDSPATKTMLRTMSNVSIEVDEARLTSSSSKRNDVRDKSTPSSLVDEISDMKDYLTNTRGQVPYLEEDSKGLASIEVVSTTDMQASFCDKNNPLVTSSSVKSKERPNVFTFDDDSSANSDHSDSVIIEDLQTISADVQRIRSSYDHVTNQLNEMMDKPTEDQLVPIKPSNTPLQDLYDQISLIINAQKSVSPVRKNKTLTHEPNQAVLLNLKNNVTPIDMASSKSRHILPSSKSKTLTSIIRTSPSTEIRQTNRTDKNSARKSARQLYFYKSPRNSDVVQVKLRKDKSKKEIDEIIPSSYESSGTSDETNPEVAKNDAPSKAKNNEPTNDSDSSLASQKDSNRQIASSKKVMDNKDQSASTTLVKQRQARPLHVTTSNDSVYKSRIQTIRASGNKNGLSSAGETLDPFPGESTLQRPTSAKNAARKLYFFKSPSAEPSDAGQGVSELMLPTIGLPPKRTPSPTVVKAKSLNKASPPAAALSPREQIVIQKHIHRKGSPSPTAAKAKSLIKSSPPSIVLSPREQMAIDKHIHSMKKKNASRSRMM